MKEQLMFYVIPSLIDIINKRIDFIPENGLSSNMMGDSERVFSTELLSIPYEEIVGGEVIGRGSFGTVIRGLWKDVEVAVKFFEGDKELLDAFSVEANQLSRVNHENIIRLFGASFSPPHHFLVMEYADGGSLYKVLHQSQAPYHSGHALNWLLQCAKGVEYLHSLKPTPIAHRDLKSPNLLLVNSGLDLKLCDFGTACKVQTYMTNNKGSAAWMAPEVFEGDKYTEKCDIYSHGILTWEVLTRRLPFDEINGNNWRILWAIYKGHRPPLISGCPKVIEDLMTKCWDRDPAVRPTMTEIVQKLSYIQQFFPSIENDPLLIETLVEEEDSKEETSSFVSALTSSQSKSEVKKTHLISSSDEYPEKLPSVINTNSVHLDFKQDFFTPPELAETESDVIPPLPTIDPSSILNPPPELLRSKIWVDEDSGPIPSDIEVFRDRSSEEILTPIYNDHAPDHARIFGHNFRQNFHLHPTHRYPLSDFRPRVGNNLLLSTVEQQQQRDLSNSRPMPYETLSGLNYPKVSPFYGRLSPSPRSSRRTDSKTSFAGDINGLFSVKECTSSMVEKNDSFKKGHRRANSYESSCGGGIYKKETHDPHQSIFTQSNNNPELRMSFNDLRYPFSQEPNDFYERESMIDRSIDLIDPDLRPVPPQPNCPQSMKIYRGHRLLASEYLQVKNELEQLRNYKASLESQLQEGDDSEGQNAETELANQVDVEAYVQKQSEKDSLLQFHDKLSKQLRLLKSTSTSSEPEYDTDWVFVNERN